MRQYLHTSIFSFLLFISITVLSQAPVINSFSPLSAPAGASVIINGNNFSNTATNNIVYFGGVKANVTVVSPTSITATVPKGSLYQPISVTVDTFTAFSHQPFITSFGAGTSFDNNSFSDTFGIAPSQAVCFADLDNDGLPDMVGGIAGNKVAVYKNTGSPAQASFAISASYASPTLINQVIAKDLTGDGKLDIAIISSSNTYVEILKNTSTSGSISFEDPFYYGLSFDFEPYSIDGTDIDGDGKTDIVIGYWHSGTCFSVLRNNGVAGALSFATKVNFAFGTVPGGAGNVGSDNTVYARDIDGDGKPDVVSMSRFFSPYLIYRNTSVPGAVSFAAKVAIESGRGSVNGNGAFDVKLADMDGDGKADIIHTVSDSAQVSLYRNTSTAGNISFGGKQNFPGPDGPVHIGMNDMDGDGKVDISLLTYYSTCVIKNNSTAGNVLLEDDRCYYGDFAYQQVALADIDTDGKADIVISGPDVNNGGRRRALALRNLVYGPVITSITPSTAGTDTVITIKGIGFTGTTTVSFGNINAVSFTVVSDSVITATVANGASGYITVITTNGIAKFPGFNFTKPIPHIYSFSPAAGPVGSSVIIKGKNFNAIPEENIVYFGAVAANVTSSTDTTITATVPVSPGYYSLSVNNGNDLTAYSTTAFNVMFDGGAGVFTAANFSDPVSYAVPASPLFSVAADFDGDLLPDLAVPVYVVNNYVSVFRNTTTNNTISFASKQDHRIYHGPTFAQSGGPTAVAAADMDGDGKKDMVTVNGYSDSVSVFLNTGSVGNISFATKKDFLTTGSRPDNILLADLDADGKTEMIVTNTGGASLTAGSVTILKNISTPGNIAAVTAATIPVNGPPAILVHDLDNDHKPDIITINKNTGRILFFRNISTTGTVILADSVSLEPLFGSGGLRAADLNADGKMDLLYLKVADKTITAFSNNSTAGNLSFTNNGTYPLPNRYRYINFSDLNGDGKTDVVITNDSTTTLSFYINTGTGNTISFAPRADIVKNISAGNITAADVTGDAKPDLIVSGTISPVYILRNQTGDPKQTAICPGLSNTSVTSNVSGSNYQWQVNDGNGFVNISDNGNYVGTATNTLTINSIPSSWYGYQYRCVADGINSVIFTLKVEDTWTGAVSNEWENPLNWSCGKVPNEYTDVIISNGTPLINSNVTVRSIKLTTGASLNVGPGFSLVVLH